MDTICWTLKRMNIILCAEVKQALVQMMICCRAHQSESAAAAAAAQLTYEFVCKLNVYHIKRVSQRDAESCSTGTLLTSPPALTLPWGSDMTTFWAVQNLEHTIISSVLFLFLKAWYDKASYTDVKLHVAQRFSCLCVFDTSKQRDLTLQPFLHCGVISAGKWWTFHFRALIFLSCSHSPGVSFHSLKFSEGDRNYSLTSALAHRSETAC